MFIDSDWHHNESVHFNSEMVVLVASYIVEHAQSDVVKKPGLVLPQLKLMFFRKLPF